MVGVKTGNICTTSFFLKNQVPQYPTEKELKSSRQYLAKINWTVTDQLFAPVCDYAAVNNVFGLAECNPAVEGCGNTKGFRLVVEFCDPPYRMLVEKCFEAFSQVLLHICWPAYKQILILRSVGVQSLECKVDCEALLFREAVEDSSEMRL